MTNISENVTSVVTTVTASVTRKQSIGEALNPINFVQKISLYIQSNRILFILLICVISLGALWLGYAMIEEWRGIPPRERSFRVGKTNVIQVFLEELKEKMRRKKKRFG